MTTYFDTLRQVMDGGEGDCQIDDAKLDEALKIWTLAYNTSKGDRRFALFQAFVSLQAATALHLPLIREVVRQNERYREALKLFMVATDKIERTDLLYDTRIKAREALQETLDKEVL